ncbi:hypothetical protein HDU97_004484 [Phlyctochytrium planicorne]|nr:hypothetical protein HDU97_004484 [Phlyctochytrium planicorne]
MTLPVEITAFDVENFVDCARYGELDDMKAIIDAYFASTNSNKEDKDILRTLVTTRSAAGHTALHVASANGELAVIDYLLQYYRPNDLHIGTTEDGSTALHWAALNGKLECVERFLKEGADATFKNDDGRSAVTVAEQQGHLEVVNLLLKSFEPGEDVTGGNADQDGSGDVEEEVEDAANALIEVKIEEK